MLGSIENPLHILHSRFSLFFLLIDRILLPGTLSCIIRFPESWARGTVSLLWDFSRNPLLYAWGVILSGYPGDCIHTRAAALGATCYFTLRVTTLWCFLPPLMRVILEVLGEYPIATAALLIHCDEDPAYFPLTCLLLLWPWEVNYTILPLELFYCYTYYPP